MDKPDYIQQKRITHSKYCDIDMSEFRTVIILKETEGSVEASNKSVQCITNHHVLLCGIMSLVIAESLDLLRNFGRQQRGRGNELLR